MQYHLHQYFFACCVLLCVLRAPRRAGIVGRVGRATAHDALCRGFDPCRQRSRGVAVDFGPKQSGWLINQLGDPRFFAGCSPTCCTLLGVLRAPLRAARSSTCSGCVLRAPLRAVRSSTCSGCVLLDVLRAPRPTNLQHHIAACSAC